MEPIKVILVVAFIVILFWAFRHRRRVGLRAGTRVALLVLTARLLQQVVRADSFPGFHAGLRH